MAIGPNNISSGRQAGFTFNELLVAMTIVVLAVMGYSLSSANVFRRQTVSSHSTIAINLAQDKIEELQAQKNLINTDLCPSGGDHGVAANGATPGPFDRCWRIAPSPLGTGLKHIDVTVSWRDYEARQVTLSTLTYRGE